MFLTATYGEYSGVWLPGPSFNTLLEARAYTAQHNKRQLSRIYAPDGAIADGYRSKWETSAPFAGLKKQYSI